MAAKGYVVLYTNPRGSSTFGQEFGNSNQYDFPGKDAKDILKGVDVLVARGFIDAKKMAVTGGSGGGILTNWIVTQDQRFAAAASQRSISDWTSFGDHGLHPLHRMWTAAPVEAREPPRPTPPPTSPRSRPLSSFIEGKRTPDRRRGGEPMFRAPKYLKKPTPMVTSPAKGTSTRPASLAPVSAPRSDRRLVRQSEGERSRTTT